ncbi:MAG: mucoidy inhibitor MuiA family protein [Synechococcaceae cyanobacterium SM2_3_1]|nr:mucoidy inhibitor MuiA family protein [Synechococcaceae cyanobacterium SM2_3_1]
MTASPIATGSLQPSISTQITAVTVYANQARVTRKGIIQLTGQEQQLLVPGLSNLLRPNSIRVSGSGEIPVRIYGVEMQYSNTTDPPQEQVAQVKRQLEDLEDQHQRLENHLAALHLQQTFLQQLLEKSVDRFARGLAAQQISLEQTQQLLGFADRHYPNVANAIWLEVKEQQLLQEQIQICRNRLREIQSPNPQGTITLAVGIAAEGTGEFELEISYAMQQASWSPLYDLRVDAAADQLNLTYLASIQQWTGENWQEVELTLSTAKAGLGSLPPKLEPWYLDKAPAPIPMQQTSLTDPMQQTSSTKTSSMSSSYRMTSSSTVRSEAARSVTATPKQSEGGVVTFKLDRRGSIPSDRSPHKFTIFSADYPCKPTYIAIPKLVDFAYLQATVINPASGVSLLRGPSNIFRENDFVGTDTIQAVAPGQEFKVNLGIDEGLQVERDLVQRQVDKTLIKGLRRTSFAYRIRIRNLREHPCQLIVQEQIPVSKHEQLKVRLTQSDPSITPADLGLLEWSLNLAPKEQQSVTYQFVVEHHPEFKVSGLMD